MRWEDRNAQRRILILSSTGSKMERYQEAGEEPEKCQASGAPSF